MVTIGVREKTGRAQDPPLHFGVGGDGMSDGEDGGEGQRNP